MPKLRNPFRQMSPGGKNTNPNPLQVSWFTITLLSWQQFMEPFLPNSTSLPSHPPYTCPILGHHLFRNKRSCWETRYWGFLLNSASYWGAKDILYLDQSATTSQVKFYQVIHLRFVHFTVYLKQGKKKKKKKQNQRVVSCQTLSICIAWNWKCFLVTMG